MTAYTGAWEAAPDSIGSATSRTFRSLTCRVEDLVLYKNSSSSPGLSSLSSLLMGTQSHFPVSLPSFKPPPSIASPSVRPRHLWSDPSSGATSDTRKITRDHCEKRKNVHTQGAGYRHTSTIDTLPDDVLLEIFDFYRSQSYTYHPSIWKWHILVYVCQRWRHIIFASPHRLNLRILCTHNTPVRKNVGVWPIFPIVIDYRHAWSGITPSDEDNVIAALEQPGRVCSLRLVVTGSQLGKMATVMQEPFPVLTDLDIWSKDGNVPALPAEFFGGSAPRLQAILLHGVPIPSLPTLLMSAGDLVKLDLRNIPPTGYIAPEAMVVGLTALPRLKLFIIEFQSATPRPDQIHPPPVTRAVLPALIYFEFKGASEYLEDLAGRIDSPQLSQISTFYLDPPNNFQVAQFCKFVDRSIGPKLAAYRHAHVTFFSDKFSKEQEAAPKTAVVKPAFLNRGSAAHRQRPEKDLVGLPRSNPRLACTLAADADVASGGRWLTS
ncbi:hypothetical protein EDB89DRAFT_2242611 [Lactarius sanguifluus]|nr:hypothetical protein EDB89DRAFT_2242611 [Lactarius sanguifluus]